jgi:hypothetical protein
MFLRIDCALITGLLPHICGHGQPHKFGSKPHTRLNCQLVALRPGFRQVSGDTPGFARASKPFRFKACVEDKVLLAVGTPNQADPTVLDAYRTRYLLPRPRSFVAC